MKQQFLNRRAQMFTVGAIVWCLLAAWTVSAFWGHIDELNESYQFAARLGALAAEVIGMGFLYWHCFDRSLTVRRWALIFSVILASILVFHAGALRGLRDARTKQQETENRLTEKLMEMSTAQSKALADASAENAGKLVRQGVRQKERLALANKASAQQSNIARAAQEKVAAEIAAGNDKVKDTAIVPRWYLDGWMYGVIFMAAMMMLGHLWWKMSEADESVIDADYDGVPDIEQEFPRRHPVNQPMAVAPVSAQPAANRAVLTRPPLNRVAAAKALNKGRPLTDEEYAEYKRGFAPQAEKPTVRWQGNRIIEAPPSVEPKDARSH